MNKGLLYILEKRRIDSFTLEKFNIGFCEKNGSIEFKYNPWDTNSKLSLVYLDPRFHDSVLFPIFDLYNCYVGISARSLREDSKMKYINTVYAKGKHLYGLNVTWRDCLKKNKVYIVEGNVDVLRMYQKGIRNVVGMLGSTLGVTQLTLLSRFVDHIVFVPDGDKAGDTFIKRMLVGKPRQKGLVDKYPNLDLSFSIVKLPTGSDPDTFLKENTVDAFYKLEEPVTFDVYEHCKSIIKGVMK